MSTELGVLVLGVLLFFSAFFSASETALFSLSRLELERLRDSPRPFAARLLNLLSRPRQVLTTILFCNELVNVTIAMVVGITVYGLFGNLGWQWDILISALVATPLLLMLGDMLPKNLALRYAPVVAPIMAVPLQWFYWLISPVRWILSGIADWCVRRFGGDPELATPLIMEEEFRRLVDLGVAGGAIKSAEHDLIDQVFAFGDTCVGEWITPVDKIFSISLNAPFEVAVEKIRESPHSRIPVYQENPNDIVGMIYARDLLMSWHHRKLGRMRELEEIVRPVLFMSRDTRVEDALKDFQKSKIHLAVVTDEHQKVLGILTMDKMLDRLFGLKGAA
jgi:putative hemolysin